MKIWLIVHARAPVKLTAIWETAKATVLDVAVVLEVVLELLVVHAKVPVKLTAT